MRINNQITIGAMAHLALRAALALLASLAIVLSLAGCWGSGALASPFRGTFAGPWTSTGADSGTASFLISPGGSLTGTADDTTINLEISVTGALHNDGTFSGTAVPQGHNPVNVTGTFQISQDENTLTGQLTYGGVTYTYALSRQ